MEFVYFQFFYEFIMKCLLSYVYYDVLVFIMGLLCVYYLLEPVTELAYVQGLIVSN